MKTAIALNNFCTMLHLRCLTRFWICLGFWVSQGSEYTSVLKMPGFCICLWFSMCQRNIYIYHWTVVCGLIYQGKEQSKNFLFSSRGGVYVRKKSRSVNSIHAIVAHGAQSSCKLFVTLKVIFMWKRLLSGA